MGSPGRGGGFPAGVCEDAKGGMDFTGGCYLGVENSDLFRVADCMRFSGKIVAVRDFVAWVGILAVGVEFWC